MKRSFHIKLYKSIGTVHFYTIHFTGEESETDKFIQKYLQDEKYKTDLSQILITIKNIGERGAYERRFRPEKGFHALPIEKCKLRLICLRLTDNAVIIGNGGAKIAQTVQQCPDIYPHFLLMEKLEKEYRTRIRTGDIYWKKGKLKGELSFKL